jgi:apolipoprotein N-acyltransferase
MTSPKNEPIAPASARTRVPPAILLSVGAVFVFMTFMRGSLAELGWVAFAPFLIVVHQPGSRWRQLALFGALAVGFLAAVSKMATEEIPWVPVPMFAIPFAFSYFLAVTVGGAAHRRLGARWGVYAFAAMAVLMSWIQYRFTPGSSWGALAYTQVDNLPFVQLAAVAGIAGMTFLVAMGSGLAAAAWSSGLRAVRADLAVFAVVLAGSLLYGQLRLWQPAPGPSVTIGSVVSPVTHKEFHAAAAGGIDAAVRPFDDELFRRSAVAVDRGAKIVVWNEMATLVTVPGEAALAARGQAFAKQRGVMLVMAYGVFDSLRPLHDTNKYRVYLPDGWLADEYVKRHPVPGDPDAVGQAHARAIDFGGVRYAGAICYDYGFPEIARDNARDGADVALVPASDWRGIDPLHGRMALVNAVAVGLPLVRPVRGATSIASDAYGRVLGSLRADGASDGVLVASVPAARVPTLFFRTGDLLPLAALAFCLLAVGRMIARSRRRVEGS